MTSTTAYAVVSLRNGAPLQWFAQSELGLHETVSNWVRGFAADEIDTGTLAGKVQYDNGPAVAPSGAANALVSVRFLDMTAQGVGDSVDVRKDGEVRVTLRYPVEGGDAPLLVKSEAVAQAFQGVTVPVNVRFRSPTLSIVGLSGGYYEADVVVPFYKRHTPPPPVGASGVAASWDDVADAIRARYADAVAAPTAWDNAPNPSSGGVLWTRLTLLHGARRRVESPPRYRSGGVAVASIFVPSEVGDAPGYRVADAVYEAFVGALDSGVEFGMPNVRTIGRTEGSPWWQVNVDCPFTAFHST